MEYLYIVCIGLLVFFSFSLLTKKNKTLSERIFSSWIVLLLITVFSFLLYAKGLARTYPVFITFICDSHFLHGPLLYLYVLAFTNVLTKLHKVHLWHLMPMIVQVLAKLYLNYGLGVMDCYEEGGCVESDNIYVMLVYFYKYLVLGAYIYITWEEIKTYKKTAHTPREQMRLAWVQQIALGSTFLYLGILLIQLGPILLPGIFWEKMLLGNTLATLFIFIFLYIGNSYAYLFVSPSKNRFKNLSESFNQNACKQNLPDDEFHEVFTEIEQFMTVHQPFTKSQLTIKELSERIGIPAASISQAVNKSTGKSVTDYVNKFRVELLIKKLSDPTNKNYTIMALADECGFSSKSTLNRIFKQHTSQTPGEFLKSIQ